MKTNPLTISVITVTLNCRETVDDFINSISDQSWSYREHIVVDGFSSDGTLQLLENRRQKFNKFLSEPDKGIYDALNKGIKMSSGDVIGFLHADDIYANNDVLAKIAKVFSEDSTVCAVYGDLQYVSKNDVKKVLRHWKSKPFNLNNLNWGWMPPHPSLYVRRECYDKIGLFDHGYHISADYLSILKLFSMPNFKSVYIPEVFIKMRVGGKSNRSLKNIMRKSFEDFRALRQVKIGAFGGFGALLWKNLSKLLQFI